MYSKLNLQSDLINFWPNIGQILAKFGPGSGEPARPSLRPILPSRLGSA